MKNISLNTFHGNSKLLQDFITKEIEFLVIGGMAVKYYCQNREACDLDLLTNNSLSNAEKIKKFFIENHFTSPDFSKLVSYGLQISLKNYLYFADLLTPKENQDFLSMWERRVIGDINNIKVPFISKEDLINMKKMVINDLGEDMQKHQNDILLLQK